MGAGAALGTRKARVVLLLLVVPLVAMALAWRWPALGAVAAIFWIILSLPIAILAALDWYRRPRPKGEDGGMGRKLLRLPILFLGFAAGVIGLAILGGVIYSVFWEKRYELHALASFSAALGMIGFGVYCIRLGTTSGPPEE